MYFLLLIAKYFFVLASLFGLGSILNYAFLKRFFQEQGSVYVNLLINILFGYLLIGSCTATFSTKGNTLQLLILLILVFYLVQKRSKSKTFEQNQKIPIKKVDYFVVLACFILSITVIYVGNGFPDRSINIDVNYDYYFYAHLSQSIVEQGVENIFTLFSSYVPVSKGNLYHYSDLWFTGFVALISDTSEIETLLFVNYPVLIFLSLIGGIALIGENATNSPLLKLWIVIAVFFGLSSYLPLTDFALYKQAFFRYNGCVGCNHFDTKITIILPLLILAFYKLNHKSIISFVFFLIIVMVAYNTTIPAITGGAVTILMFTRFIKFKGRKPTFPHKEVKRAMLFLLTFLFILFLYLKFNTNNESLDVIAEEVNLKSLGILFVEHLLSPWIVYWMLGLIILYLLLKKRVSSFLIYSIVFVFGLLLAATLFVVLNHGLMNVNQALANIVFPLFLVLGIVCVTLLDFRHKLFYLLLISLSVNGIFNFLNKSKHNRIKSPIVNSMYSIDFKLKVLEKFESQQGQKWLTLGTNKYPTWHYSLVDIGQFILTFKDANYPLDLSAALRSDIKIWCENGSNHLYPFCNEVALKDKDGYILDFISKKEIDFLFVEDDKIIPEYLIPHIHLELTDSITNHQLYSFKRR